MVFKQRVTEGDTRMHKEIQKFLQKLWNRCRKKAKAGFYNSFINDESTLFHLSARRF